MPALNHLSASADPAFALPRHAVGLIDRRTGKPRRISAIPLRLIACAPLAPTRDMMPAALWGVAIHRLDHKGALL
ncbi:hypothetical protein SAMN04488021_10488 [Paracoccus aminovorans]|uniref:Uncharacterized protein n=1 Tax=Paracoccus aminovorans TaxID=34004 RepID=A0A1I2YI41_9RHOB|nr:hypothetical protein [Paracoccus aminovorans]CQR86701.1 hypothetical protein JCM7685_2143 [Paracoccus aminovorans]SFH25248.1 hypothetical protein SAMN04488021_10488 [Paracoccus aminovorans]